MVPTPAGKVDQLLAWLLFLCLCFVHHPPHVFKYLFNLGFLMFRFELSLWQYLKNEFLHTRLHAVCIGQNSGSFYSVQDSWIATLGYKVCGIFSLQFYLEYNTEHIVSIDQQTNWFIWLLVFVYQEHHWVLNYLFLE